MRIGIEVSAVTTRPTGIGTYVREILQETLRIAGDTEFHGFSSGLGDMDVKALAGLRAHRHMRVPTRTLYKCWGLLGAPKVDVALGGVDLYHATNFFLPPVKRARRLLSVYDLTFLRHPEWCSPKIVGPFSHQIARAVRDADGVLTCSEASKRDIVELLSCAPDKVTVAYGAADAMFRPCDRASAQQALVERHGIEGPYVLFVSTIEPRKNVDGLLAAFARMQDHVPHTLVLAGAEGWNQEPVATMIARHGIARRVRHIGYVRDRSDLPLLYSAADAFVLPSFYEGFGIPVLEAMACGCPVITTRRASLPEAGGEAAQYVDPDDPENIAYGIRKVLQSPGLAEDLRARGLVQAARFTWAGAAERVLACYRELAP
jgi:glycosyltransferase involved in cell wall biosynthesis